MPFDNPKDTEAIAKNLRTIADAVENRALGSRIAYNQDNPARCSIAYARAAGIDFDRLSASIGQLDLRLQEKMLAAIGREISCCVTCTLFGNNRPGEKRTRAQQVEMLRTVAGML